MRLPLPLPSAAEGIDGPSLTVAALLIGGFGYVILRDAQDLASPLWLTIGYGSAIVLTVGLTGVAIDKWWHYADRATSLAQRPHESRVLKVACIVGMAGLVPAALLATDWAVKRCREAVQRQRMANYVMQWNPNLSEIAITGHFGPGFAKRLEDLMLQHTRPCAG
jgi:hypothetical protein